MKETHLFTMPDYYPEFQCKIGGCRHACCEGWPVTISMKDYFHLIGVECSPLLRRRLDDALRLCENPTIDSYARICQRFDGNCGVRLEDGRCGLQAELGEEALAMVCRLYPRGIRHGDGYECSCANSCEAMLELFLHRVSPLEFIERQWTTEMPSCPETPGYFDQPGREMQLRMHLIRLLQDRRQTMAARLQMMGDTLHQMAEALRNHDDRILEEILEKNNILEEEYNSGPTPAQLTQGLLMAEAMMEEIDRHRSRVSEFGASALQWFRSGTNPMEQYRIARRVAERILPTYPFFFEHTLVNHCFFERFPFQVRPDEFYEEYCGLCGSYAMVRFLGLGWLATHPSETEFIDVCAAAFRMIEHSSFESYAAGVLHQLNFDSPEKIAELVSL